MAGPRVDERPLGWDDYVRIPDDGRRHEIIGGRHFVMPAPAVRHQRASMRLSYALYDFVSRHELGEVLAAPVDVVLSPHDIVQPDLVFVGRERSGIVGEQVRGAPDLVIEIVSKTSRRRDEGVKLELYRRSGVQEYWIVDPGAETVAVWSFARSPARDEPAVVGSGERVPSTVLGGLELAVGEIFAANR